jgi:hypothetical protein
MFIPFIRSADARDLLEQERYNDEARGELLAEYGSSAFYGGATSADAMCIAHNIMFEREEDFRQSEEGELYFARLDAARLYEGIPALHEWDIPEFVDGKTSWAHSPFPPFRGTLSDDDIPF